MKYLFPLLILLYSCSSTPKTITPQNLQLDIRWNYFKGKRIPFITPEDFKYTFSDNLVLYPDDDTLEIRAIGQGNGYIYFWNKQDTFLNVQVNVENDSLVTAALAKIATGDPFIYKNDDLSNWIQHYILLNQHIPDFSLRSIYGDIIDQHSLKGKTALINFWYYGCPPCEQELPDLQKAGKHFKKDPAFAFFAFCKDSGFVKNGKPYFEGRAHCYTDDSSWVETRYNPIKLDMIHGIQAAPLDTVFQFFGYPTTFLVDKKGIIRYVFKGMALYKPLVQQLELLSHLQ